MVPFTELVKRMGREWSTRFKEYRKSHFGHFKLDTSRRHAEEDVM